MFNLNPLLYLLSFMLFSPAKPDPVLPKNCSELLQECEKLLDQGNSNMAEICYQAVSECLEEQGDQSTVYAMAITNIANIAVYNGRLDEADSLISIAWPIFQRTDSASTRGAAALLGARSIILQQKGKPLEALSMVEQSTSIMKDLYGVNSKEYATSISSLSTNCFNVGQVERAIQLIKKSLEIKDDLFGKNNFTYATGLGNLGMIYLGSGEYEKGHEPLLEAKTIYENHLDTSHLYYSLIIGNLGVSFIQKGQYEQAEEYILKNLELLASKGLQTHPFYFRGKNNLLLNYAYLKQFDKLKEITDEEIGSMINTLGKENDAYSMLLDKQRYYYLQQGQYEEAISVTEESLEVLKRITGDQSYNYLLLQLNLSELYSLDGQNSRAFQICNSTIATFDSLQWTDHPEYAMAKIILAKLLLKQGEEREAEKTSLAALAIAKNSYGEKHPRYPDYLVNTARILETSGNLSLAADFVVQYDTLLVRSLFEQFRFLTEKEKLSYLLEASGNLKYTENFLHRNYEKHPEIASYVFNHHTALREALLDNTRVMVRSIREKGEEELNEQLDQWFAIKQLLAKENSAVSSQRLLPFSQLDSLEKVSQDFEKELVKNSSDFEEKIRRTNINWQKVEQNLATTEAVVDFFEFPVYDLAGDSFSNTVLYYALVGRKGFEHPQVVRLCEKADLEKQLQLLNKKYISPSYTHDRAYSPKLYTLIWEHLNKKLEGVKKVYYVTDGRLHNLSFDAIPTPDGHFLGGQYQLERIGSPRDIIDQHPLFSTDIASALIMGGIVYDVGDDGIHCEELVKKEPVSKTRGTPKNKLSYLEGGAEEAEAIKQILQNKKVKVIYKKGCEADETYFKTLGQSVAAPTVIHLSTHGLFYIVEDEEGRPDFQKDTRHRSSLALAGYNRKIGGKTISPKKEDGELFSIEVAHLNLLKTRLIVLSSCVSGLGEIHSSEGVFGFQRAFRQAGVEHVMTSLWDIGDAATSLFMQHFYESWYSNGKTDVKEALRQAQQKMREGEYKHPIYWAGFVLI